MLVRNAGQPLDDDLVIDVEADLAAAFGLSPLEGLGHSMSEEKHRRIDERNATAAEICDLKQRLSDAEEKFRQQNICIEICERAEAMAEAGKLAQAAE
jgi:hypothetical protein